MQLLITFHCRLPIFASIKEAKIIRKTYFKLVSTEERDLNDFLSVANKITTFLCFAIDKIVCLDNVMATSNSIYQENSAGKIKTIPIRIYCSSLIYSKDASEINWDRMLFRYGEIQDYAERIINNWINAYDKIDPALNLYFSTRMGERKYIEDKFLALAQCLETYHRRTSDERLMDEVKFKELTENILCQCPEEHKEWLAGRLRHGNEINLSKRIKNIIKPFNDVIGTRTQREKIIRNIVDTRNYLTHFDESLEPKIASSRDLCLLCFKMEAFFQLHLLQVLGFTQEEVESILNNCYNLKRKLKKTDKK